MLLLFMRGLLFWSPILTLTPLNRAWLQWSLVLQVRCSEGTLVVQRSCEGTWKLSTCQPRSQCFSLLFYLLFFRDWNAVFQYHTIQCLLIFCSTYHRQPSVCFTEASRYNNKKAEGSKLSQNTRRKRDKNARNFHLTRAISRHYRINYKFVSVRLLTTNN